MSNKNCKLIMHMGGTFHENPLRYVGGEVHEWDVDPDYLCQSTFAAMVTAKGFQEVMNFSFVEPGLPFAEGLRVCYDNASYGAMLCHMKTHMQMHIYVGHGVSEANVVDDLQQVEGAGALRRAHNAEMIEVVNGASEVDNEVNEDDGGGPQYKIHDWSSTDDDINDIGRNYSGEGNNRPTWERYKEAAEELEEEQCTDYLASDDPGEEVIGSDGEVMFKSANLTYYDPLNPVVHLEIGMLFKHTQEFKDALADYCIAKHFDIEYEKNDKTRVRAHCKADFCPFHVFAGVDKQDDLFKIKKLTNKHECSRVFKNSRASYKYLGKKFIPKLRIFPTMSLEQMYKTAAEEFEVEASLTTLGRARRWALREINGNVKEEFNKLFDYVRALRTVDLQGNFELMCERRSPRIQSLSQPYSEDYTLGSVL